MSKIGIIYTAFNTDEYLDRSLDPWVAARRAGKDGGAHQFLISAVSVPFVGFDSIKVDDTPARLNERLRANEIDHLISDRTPMRETDARGEALRWLVQRGVDATIMVDSDEMWIPEQIAAVLSFVEATPLVTWFKVSFKNRVFTLDQYLVAPFTPPRIHRVIKPRAMGFWDDNNVYYEDHGTQRRDIDYASMTIPQSVAWVEHLTWLSDDRSRLKSEYQRRRWGSSSFKWDYVSNCLEWDQDYFLRHGLSFPPDTLTD